MASFVFVDPRVQDLDNLLAGLGKDVQVVVLGARRDGIEQLAGTLSGLTDAFPIYTVSYDSGGTRYIGTTELSSAPLQGSPVQLFLLGSTETQSVELLSYAGDGDKAVTGQSFNEQVALYTGAGITASTPAHRLEAARDGESETSTGRIDPKAIIPAPAQEDHAVTLEEISDTVEAGNTQPGTVSPIPIHGLDGGSSTSLIVFVDSRVADADNLLWGVGTDVHVVRLNAAEDGITQIQHALVGVKDLSAIHII